MYEQEQKSSHRNTYSTPIVQNQRQLPPLTDLIKPEAEASVERKAKLDEGWEFSDCSSVLTTPTATSPTYALGTSMPSLGQAFDDLNFCIPSDNMLSNSNGWTSATHYQSPIAYTSATTTTSPSQAYYPRSITTTTTRGPQNLPSLTEMNLANSNASYGSRALQVSRPHGSPPYYGNSTDPLEISYAKTSQAGYGSSFGMISTPRTTYPVSAYGDWSPVSDACCYGNASWPPTIHYSNANLLGSDTASIGSAGRRRRGNLPKHVTDVLRAWFHDHLDHPYPTDEDKQMLINKTHLTISQISNWFINARRRHWPQWKQQREHLHTLPPRHASSR